MKKLSECIVLIVDDTEANVDVLVAALGDDYEISVAMDGEGALENVEIETPDIILLDIMMPGMDGYEVCRRLKANKLTADIPIIFLTAMTDIISKSKGFQLGAVDYVTKPFEILEVKARVRTHLSLKLAKYELLEKNQILEEKAVELQAMVNELEAFSYTVSHDLKSPLRAIEVYSRIILEEQCATLDKDENKMLSNIIDICNDMIAMISKLLEYSTTTRLEICKEPINISEMFNSAFSQLKSLYLERFIELEFETGIPPVLGDTLLIKQVVYNILSNAIKFTRNREKALVVVGCKMGVGEYIFYVRDNGVGIDMEFCGKLFRIFQRLHSTDEFEGNGIGLATVGKIIQKHGGKTWIEGKLNEGATIYFTLPSAIKELTNFSEEEVK
ncbi:response regulator [Clostridium tagluense]|uniref:sensor histidine kinase n=1 Tax=Clostridium tagluense TaxID=360422 RepID=UPI001CF1BD98|nr:response regulator [Clostridium tagluense]MCB2312597.1 response regulator [Clostridium tagluense]MCB2317273.1 response regulator [Clostridium tagluense]MCB2322140.1 response regulator [Clostridium tagluense]MCB2327069.1 response regulator [Clostridium tagluense]MCB2331787.1 response regulator [Clostridium tagluense]